MRVIGKAAMLAILAVSFAACEASASEGSGSLVALTQCQQIADGSQRLACYDRAITELDQAQTKGDVIVVDRDQARKVRRQAFGFSLPSIALFERGESREELDAISGVVGSARQNVDGRWIVRLEDGAIWTQADDNPITKAPRAGMHVRVRKAALGSFLMNVDGQRAVRVRRTG